MKKFVNILTIIRLIATFFIPVMWMNFKPIALLTFIIVMLLTDFVDGKLARWFHVQTLFGSLLDMVSDKLFGIVALLMIALYNNYFYALVVCEIIISFVNVGAASFGAVAKSSYIGKFKMWILGFATVIGTVSIFKASLFNGITSSFLKDIIRIYITNETTIINAALFITVGAELIVIVDYIHVLYKDIKRGKKRLNIKEIKFKKLDEIAEIAFDTEYYINNRDKSWRYHLLLPEKQKNFTGKA